MPTIPSGNDRLGLIETSAPGVSRAETGQQWGAVIEAGQQIQSLGFSLAKKRKDAEDTSYSFNSKMEDLKEISAFEEELKKNTPEDGSGYYEKYNEFINERYSKGLENAPSERAKMMYQESVQPLFVKAGIEARGYENQTKAKSFKTKITDQVNSVASIYVDKPDYATAPERIRDFEAQVESQVGTLYTPAEAAEIKKYTKERIGESLLDGLSLQEKRYGEGLKLLKSHHPSVSGLSPDRKAEWEKKFLAQKKSTEAISQAETMRQIRDMSVRIMSPNGATNAEIDGLMAKVSSNPAIDQAERTRAMHELNVAKIVSGTVKDIARQPFADVQANYNKALQSIDDYTKKTGVGDYEAQVYKQNLSRTMDQIVTQREKDPVTFMANYIPEKRNILEQINSKDPSVSQAAAAEVIKYQEYLGVQNKQILTDDQAFNFASMIQTAGNADSAASIINELQGRYGESFNYVRNQIIDTKKIGSGIFTSSFLSDPKSRAAVVANERTASSLKEYKQNLSSGVKSNFQDYLSESIQDITKPLVEASADNKGLEFSQMITDAIEKEALSQMTRGADYDDAIDTAKKTIWENNFGLVKARNNAFLIPKTLTTGERSDVNAIQDFIVKKSSVPELEKTFGVGIPKEIKNQRPDLSDEDIRSRYLSDLESRGRWVANPQMTGARFMVPGSKGDLIPVKNKAGQPIEMEYAEMQSTKARLELRRQTSIPNPVIGKIKRDI